MGKKKEKEETYFELSISLPKAPKKAKDKITLFNRLLSLAEESEESLPVEIKSNKRSRSVLLDSDEFMLAVSFGKSGATVYVRASVYNPEKNIDDANEVGNKLINYLNTILGKGATGSLVSSTKTLLHPKKTINLATKVIGEGRIAKINEKIKQTLSPIGVFFEYTINEREFAFTTLSNERSADILLSHITYKGKMPFDLLRTEHSELANPADIIKRLAEVEL